MDKIKEVTKNFFVCGILMLIAGIALVAVGKRTFGVLAVVCAVVFVVLGIVYLYKDLFVIITENERKSSCKSVIFVIILKLVR